MKTLLILLTYFISLNIFAQSNFGNENLISGFVKHLQSERTLDLQGDTLFIAIIDSNNSISRYQYLDGKISEGLSSTMCDRKEIKNHCLQIWSKEIHKNGEKRMDFRLTSWGVDDGYVKFKMQNEMFTIIDSYYVSSID